MLLRNKEENSGKTGRAFRPVCRSHIFEDNKEIWVGRVSDCSTVLRNFDQANGESMSQSCMSEESCRNGPESVSLPHSTTEKKPTGRRSLHKCHCECTWKSP